MPLDIKEAVRALSFISTVGSYLTATSLKPHNNLLKSGTLIFEGF